MSINVSDEIAGTCACGWYPTRRDPVRQAEEHATHSGHSFEFQIVRTIKVTYTNGVKR
jgi:hypothetical protein